MTTPVLTASLEQAAVRLAELGYHVFPCRPGRKEPLTSTGFKAATRDERTILHWWDQHPTANIGIACEASGISVLDIDTKHGANPSDILNTPERSSNGAPIVLTGSAPERDDQHPRSITGHRGAQVYFRGLLPTGDLPALLGCEIRGVGAYVIAPPSVHPSGVQYAPADLPPVTKLPEIPGWLRELAAAPHARVNGSSSTPVPDAITPGGRNNTLASIAGRMRRAGLDENEILAGLREANQQRCKPPLPDSEVEQIAHSISRYPAPRVTGFAPLAKDAKEAAQRLSVLLGLAEKQMHVTAARLFGKGGLASIEIDVSNGETLSFSTLREMMRPQSLIVEVAACTGVAPVLKQVQCAEAVTLARQVATRVEVDSENDIAREWGHDFLDLADVLDLDINNQAERWRAFELLATRHPWDRHITRDQETVTQPLVLRHLDGTRYVRTLWFERYVKNRDSSVARTAIGPRMARVGWGRRGRYGDIKATAPGRSEVRVYPFWVVPEDWNGLQEQNQ